MSRPSPPEAPAGIKVNYFHLPGRGQRDRDDRPPEGPGHTAERPVVLAGEGLRWSRDRQILIDFAEASGIPVLSGGPASRGLPPRHTLNGRGIATLAALAMSGGATPDVVMLLGFTPGMHSGGRPGAVIPADAKIVQVDPDAAEIGRLGPVHVAVQADPAETLAAMLTAHDEPWPAGKEWAETLMGASKLPDLLFADAPDVVNGRIHPHHATQEALAALDPGSIVIADGGESLAWTISAAYSTDVELVVGLGHQGHLGVGHGFAIGAQHAEPGRRVVQIFGRVADAVTEYGYRWEDTDPYKDDFRLWVPDLPGLTEGANALLKARQKSLEDKGTDDDDVRALREELNRLGVVVKDEKRRQHVRTLGQAR